MAIALEHLVAKITWQSDYWQDNYSEEVDRPLATMSYMVGTKNQPGERMNFNYKRNTDGDIDQDGKVGYFSGTVNESRYARTGITFFYSKRGPNGEAYIVGLYGKAKLYKNLGADGTLISAPLAFCVMWDKITKLPVKVSDYLKDKAVWHEIIYIDDQQAKKIIRDAYSAHNDNLNVREQLKEVWKAVWDEDFTEEGNTVPNQELANSNEALKELLHIMDETNNVIIYGPPGTGKTYRVRQVQTNFELGQPVPETQFNSWLIITNDKTSSAEGGLWKWEDFLKKKSEFFTGKTLGVPQGRDIKPRPGDLVFYYRSAPIKKLVALGRIEAPQVKANVGDGFVAELLEGELPEQVHITWAEINSLFGWAGNDIQGTFRYLKPDQARQISELIQTKRKAQPKYVRFVTFHQSFSYEEFVGGIRPVLGTDELRYEYRKGVFREICEDAGNDPYHKYLLIIDEINRANIAKVFGELITLIEDDKRKGREHHLSLVLPHSKKGEEFSVPFNLYILGTMNTADRSINLIDTALRRRFAFIEMMPSYTELDKQIVRGIDLGALLRKLNSRIALELGRDRQIGHSYFIEVLKEQTDNERWQKLRFVWHYRIVPLLQEYFYNDCTKLRKVLGEVFVTKVDWQSKGCEIEGFESDDGKFLVALQGIIDKKEEKASA